LIEGGSEIVEGICCGEPQIAGRWLRNVYPNELLPRLWVNLSKEFYDVSLRHRLESRKVISDVAFCSFNL